MISHKLFPFLMLLLSKVGDKQIFAQAVSQACISADARFHQSYPSLGDYQVENNRKFGAKVFDCLTSSSNSVCVVNQATYDRSYRNACFKRRGEFYTCDYDIDCGIGRPVSLENFGFCWSSVCTRADAEAETDIAFGGFVATLNGRNYECDVDTHKRNCRMLTQPTPAPVPRPTRAPTPTRPTRRPTRAPPTRYRTREPSPTYRYTSQPTPTRYSSGCDMNNVAAALIVIVLVTSASL